MNHNMIHDSRRVFVIRMLSRPKKLPVGYPGRLFEQVMGQISSDKSDEIIIGI